MVDDELQPPTHASNLTQHPHFGHQDPPVFSHTPSPLTHWSNNLMVFEVPKNFRDSELAWLELLEGTQELLVEVNKSVSEKMIKLP